MKNIDFSCTEISGGFWKHYGDIARNSTVHAVYNRFKETGRFDAFRCDWTKDMGEDKKPHVFWDSDVAKWIEGAAYLTQMQKDEQFEKIVDEVVDLICKNQLQNGYFNSYYITVAPADRFTNRGAHELYCTGHLIEAAIAYFNATGKDKFLKCMIKNVDYIYDVFVINKTASFVTPGHEEIELALLKLYALTKNKKHLELAKFFIDNRGANEVEEPNESVQAHITVRQQKEAVGHAVRALYLYTSLAMLSNIDKEDIELKYACDALFNDITNYKMSITGGVGSTKEGEAFSYAYDLPNSSVYNETCAAIALCFFAHEMQVLNFNSVYADIIERAMYNGVISGLSLDGKKFFYTNPLELELKKYDRKGEYQPPCERVEVFDCSCCPPNIVRFLPSVSRFMYSLAENNIYCHQFAQSSSAFEINGKECVLTQTTNYPADGKIQFSYSGEPATLYVRIPSWCTEYEGETQNGYANFLIKDGDTVSIDLPMNVHIIESNPSLQYNSGRYAITRGPIVYCMEEIDNGQNLRDICILENNGFEIKNEDYIVPTIYAKATRREAFSSLYRQKSESENFFDAKLIPYFAFANRGESDMLVWTQVK